MSSSSRCANRREWLLAAGLLIGAPAQAQGLPELPADWAARGTGRMRFLGLKVYDIELWAPTPVKAQAWPQQPLALSLRYARALKGRLIAERSLEEMRRQGPIADADAQRWLQTMTALFPDVGDGDRLTGRHDPAEGARFWFNGQPRPPVADLAFSRRFFGIWLSEQTSEPALREQLLRPA